MQTGNYKKIYILLSMLPPPPFLMGHCITRDLHILFVVFFFSDLFVSISPFSIILATFYITYTFGLVDFKHSKTTIIWILLIL